jgi:hypothetical protein
MWGHDVGRLTVWLSLLICLRFLRPVVNLSVLHTHLSLPLRCAVHAASLHAVTIGRDSRVENSDKATGWTTGVRFPAVAEVFIFVTASRPAPRPTQLTIQWVPGAFFPGSKVARTWSWPHSPCSAEVKNARSYTTTPSGLHVVVLS